MWVLVVVTLGMGTSMTTSSLEQCKAQFWQMRIDSKIVSAYCINTQGDRIDLVPNHS